MNLFKYFKKRSSVFSYCNISITGARESNQDESLVMELGLGSAFFAIADGMGGTANGQIASNIAINIAYDTIENKFKNGKNINPEELKSILRHIFMQVQNSIKKHIVMNPGLKGMGTTLTCLLIHEGKYAWGNIGDSKIYKINPKEVFQITEDNTYVNDYKKENGNILPLEIKKAYGHILTRCLDGGDDKPDIYPLEKDYEMLEGKDMFLLCSDGLLLNNIHPGIFKSRYKKINLQKTGQMLIEKSIKEGSTDNITIILNRMEYL